MTIDRKGFLAIMMFILAGFIVEDAVYFFAVKVAFPLEHAPSGGLKDLDSYSPVYSNIYKYGTNEDRNRPNIYKRSVWYRTVLIIEGIEYIAIGLVGGGLLLWKGKIELKGKTET